MTLQATAWRNIGVTVDSDWGTLSRQLAPNGMRWGVTSGGHNYTVAAIITSTDGSTWQRTPFRLLGSALVASGGSVAAAMQGGTTASGVSVMLLMDGTTLRVARTTNPDPTVLSAWTVSASWSRTDPTKFQGQGTTQLLYIPGRGYAFTGLAETVTGQGGVPAFLLSNDDFATFAMVKDYPSKTTTVIDPDYGSQTVDGLIASERGVAFHTDGLLGVAHIRHDITGAPFRDAVDGSTIYAGGLLQFVTLDGGFTWHYCGRSRDTAGALAPVYFPVGGDVLYHAGRFYSVCSDRRYTYTSSNTFSNDSRAAQSAVWIYSIDAETLRSTVAARVAAGHPEEIALAARWALEAELPRPVPTRTTYLAGMPTFGPTAVDGSVLLSVVEEPNGLGANTYVLDLTLPAEVPTDGYLDFPVVGTAEAVPYIDFPVEAAADAIPPLAHPPITRVPCIFILDRSGDVAAVLCNEPPSDPTAQASCRVWGDKHTEGLDGTLTYEWMQEALHPDAQYSRKKTECIFRDQDGDPRLMRIERVDTVQDGDTHYLHVYAENDAQELLGHPVRKPASTPPNTTASAILASILAGSRWQPGVVEYDGLHPAPNEYMPALEALRALEADSTLEARYRVTFNGSQVTGRYIDLLTRRGRDTGKVIEYGKDLLGMTMTDDGMPLYTRHIPLGRADAAGNRLLISGITWGAGDPMLKAAGLDYLDNPVATALYGPGGNPITRFIDLPDCVTAEALIHAAYIVHVAESNPQPTYEISVAFLERAFGMVPGSTAPYEQEAMRLGDNVTVRNRVLDVTTSQRIRSIEVGYFGMTSAPTVGGTNG